MAPSTRLLVTRALPRSAPVQIAASNQYSLVARDDSFYVTFKSDRGEPGGAIFKFSPEGDIDTSFASNGLFIGDSLDIGISDLVLTESGEIAVLVSSLLDDDGNATRSGVLLLDGNGAAIQGFGNNGVARFAPDDVVIPFHLDTDSAGRFVVAGTQITGTNAQDLVIDQILGRLLPDGSTDASFGDDGLVVFDVDQIDRPQDLLVDPDDKVVISTTRFVGDGFSDPFTDVNELYRFTSTGNLDENFGVGGVAEHTRIPDNTGVSLPPLVVGLADGSYVVSNAYSPLASGIAPAGFLTLVAEDGVQQQTVNYFDRLNSGVEPRELSDSKTSCFNLMGSFWLSVGP